MATGDDNFSNTNGDNYSVNGQSGRYNNYEIDGQSNNDNSIGGPLVFFGNQDAIEQLQVITNEYSAQYGRNAGAVENYITKSGTNSFHGTVFDLYQSQFLSSLTNSEKNPLFGYCPPGVTRQRVCLRRPSALCGESRRSDHRRSGFQKQAIFFLQHLLGRVRTGVTPSESVPVLTPDATGLATIASTFAGDPGAAAIADFGPYSIAAGNPQPIPVPPAFCPAADTTEAGLHESVTDASGATAIVEVAGVHAHDCQPLQRPGGTGAPGLAAHRKRPLLFALFLPATASLGLAGGDGIAAGDLVDVPSDTYSIGADWTHTLHSQLRRPVAL